MPSAVNQPYETRVSDEFVMEGNDAIVKCSLPSFAADFLEVISWSSGDKIYVKKSLFHGNYFKKDVTCNIKRSI